MSLNFIVFGKNEEIMFTLERVINKNPLWHALCINSYTSLQNYLNNNKIDVILFSSNIGEIEINEIENYLKINFPEVKQIHHYGGGSGLLLSEVECAIRSNYFIERPAINCIS